MRHFFPKWTAEGAGNCGAFTAQYSATWGHTSVAGDVLASRQVHGVMPMKSGWHRGYCFNFIRPGQKKVSSAWGVFLFLLRKNEPGEFLFYREGKAMKIRPTLDEVSLAGSRPRHHAAGTQSNGPHRRWRSDGSAAHKISHLRCAVPPGIHPDPAGASDLKKFYGGLRK